jgi:hypothetical protein
MSLILSVVAIAVSHPREQKVVQSAGTATPEAAANAMANHPWQDGRTGRGPSRITLDGAAEKARPAEP